MIEDIEINDVRSLTQIVKEKYDYDFSNYATSSLKRRLVRIMNMFQYKDFNDFQVVLVAPIGTEEEVKLLLKNTSKLTEKTDNWQIIFATATDIKNFYSQLKLKGKLDNDLGTKMIYIIDKKRNLRGRNDAKDYKEGYDTTSPADLHNEMNDDVKIILAEYRYALKKNNNKLKRIEKIKNK